MSGLDIKSKICWTLWYGFANLQKDPTHAVDGFKITPNHISPKNTPTATTWWVAFSRMEVYGWDMITRNLLAAQDGSAQKNQRHHETWRTLVKPRRNLGGTLVKLCWNLGGTFRGTFCQPKTDLPQRPIESPKAILPWNLYYGWRPQSYCCWGREKRYKFRAIGKLSIARWITVFTFVYIQSVYFGMLPPPVGRGYIPKWYYLTWLHDDYNLRNLTNWYQKWPFLKGPVTFSKAHHFGYPSSR